MNKIIKILLLFYIFYFLSSFCMQSKFDEFYKLLKSASIFHISILYNSIKYGSSFTFNQIANDQFENSILNNNFKIECDKDGNIIKFNDGKKTPLVLGSMPRKKEHLNQLNQKFNLGKQKIIGIYSLNRKFERDWSGLSDLLNKNSEINFYKYPTVDFTAPSFIDILRIVRDLENRDLKNQDVAYVHCKAGRGRGASAIIAYLMNLLHNAKIDKNYEQVEYYLRLKRPQIKMNNEHKAALKQFQLKLKEAGNLEILLDTYIDQIDKREKEILIH